MLSVYQWPRVLSGMRPPPVREAQVSDRFAIAQCGDPPAPATPIATADLANYVSNRSRGRAFLA